jgi:hypothetical protein
MEWSARLVVVPLLRNGANRVHKNTKAYFRQ